MNDARELSVRKPGLHQGQQEIFSQLEGAVGIAASGGDDSHGGEGSGGEGEMPRCIETRPSRDRVRALG